MEGSGVYKYTDKYGGAALYRGSFAAHRFNGQGICRASGELAPTQP